MQINQQQWHVEEKKSPHHIRLELEASIEHFPNQLERGASVFATLMVSVLVAEWTIKVFCR